MKKLTSKTVLLVAIFLIAPLGAYAQVRPDADGLIRPPGIASPTECLNDGGTWNSASNPYKCEFTQAQYNTTFNIPQATPTQTQPTQPTRNPNAFCTGGSCTYVPLEPLPGLPTSYGPNNGSGSFPQLISSSFRLLIGAGAVIAVVMIVLGALTYMFSDIAGNKKNALNRIRNAMWAIVLLVSSYLILYTINPELVQFNLNLGNPNNYTVPSNTPAATAPTSNTPQTQPEQETFNQQRLDLCVASGGTLHPTANNGYVCISP